MELESYQLGLESKLLKVKMRNGVNNVSPNWHYQAASALMQMEMGNSWLALIMQTRKKL